MGYYATSEGSITFKESFPKDKIEDFFDNALEVSSEDGGFEENQDSKKTNTYMIWESGKWHMDEMLTMLNALNEECHPFVEGYIEYIGEEGEYWQYIYKDGEWIEENGNRIYGDHFIQVKESEITPEVLGLFNVREYTFDEIYEAIKEYKENK